MSLVRLPNKVIDQIFEEAEHQGDYVIGLYKVAYPNWDEVSHIQGFPKVSEVTNKYIFSKAIAFDKEHHPEVINGGIWMDQGFGSDKDVPDWKVRPAPHI